MAKQQVSEDYKAFFSEIKEKIYRAQYEAMKKGNRALINLYWEIGRSIVEKQQKHKWGKSVVETLSGFRKTSLFSAKGGYANHAVKSPKTTRHEAI